jgi:hypothetical protein
MTFHLPLGVQFNNPLNVRPTLQEANAGRSNWQGVIGVEHTPSGAFLHFDGPPKGWRCAAGNVIAHYDRWNHNTIARLVGGSGKRGQSDYRPGWAPPQDRNDTAGYIARVAAATGFAPDALLNFHSYAHLKPVLLAMAEVEQGKSPYTWWNDAQIDWGLAQYGVLPPARPIAQAGPIVGAATATATAAGSALAPSYAPSYPPPVPDVATGVDPGIDPGAVLDRMQSLLQQIAPYVKWAGIALMVAIAAGLAWHWWQERRKRRPGPEPTSEPM